MRWQTLPWLAMWRGGRYCARNIRSVDDKRSSQGGHGVGKRFALAGLRDQQMMQGQIGRWRVERHDLSPFELHDLGVSQPPLPTVRLCNPTSRALVLGSTQSADVVNQARARELGVEVIRRRSGGGAVLVEPHDIVWIDVFIPRGDSLWSDDVGIATHWIGAVWQRTLSQVDLQTDVHLGAMRQAEFARTVCFAGLGPGEVVLADSSAVDGLGHRKIVGLSQRRTREGAMFQSSLYRRFDFERHRELLSLSSDDLAKLRASVAVVPGQTGESLTSRFLDELTVI